MHSSSFSEINSKSCALSDRSGTKNVLSYIEYLVAQKKTFSIQKSGHLLCNITIKEIAKGMAQRHNKPIKKSLRFNVVMILSFTFAHFNVTPTFRWNHL